MLYKSSIKILIQRYFDKLVGRKKHRSDKMKGTFCYDCNCKRVGSKKKLSNNHCLICLFRVLGERLDEEVSMRDVSSDD